MSRPSLRGGLKANAVVLLRLISSPSTRKDNPVLPAMKRILVSFPSLLAVLALVPGVNGAEVTANFTSASVVPVTSAGYTATGNSSEPSFMLGGMFTSLPR